MRHSLRGQLLIGTSLASIAILGLLGLGVYAAMRHALMKDFDASLKTDARLVAGMVQQDQDKLGFEFDPRQMPDFLSDSRERYFEIWRENDSVLARSPSLADRDLEKPAATTILTETALPDSHRGRAVVVSFAPTQEEQDDKKIRYAQQTVFIAVAAEPIEVRRTLRLLAWLLTILCGSAVVILGAILLRVVGRGLAPVTTLAGEIESLNETELGRRLPADAVPDELAPVVHKLNGLLTRLEQAFVREKSFTADVAHELRTPLAGLRSTLEVCRSRPRDSTAYEAALDDCRGITDRMEAMVQSLLLLARSDAGQMAIESQEVDLSRLVSEISGTFQYRAESRNVKMTLQAISPVIAATDPYKLQIVLQNLLDNAVSYVNQGGEIRISVARDARGPMIEIANTGSQISSEDAPRLFERFWRGDAARTDAGLHCGLGLSLSKRLIALLGGEISIQNTSGGEFVVRLQIPAAKKVMTNGALS
jgi:heavy metal sensor kinase